MSVLSTFCKVVVGNGCIIAYKRNSKHFPSGYGGSIVTQKNESFKVGILKLPIDQQMDENVLSMHMCTSIKQMYTYRRVLSALEMVIWVFTLLQIIVLVLGWVSAIMYLIP